MSNEPKIFIASKEVFQGTQHLYLVYSPSGDPDDPSALVIRGGPETGNGFSVSPGNIAMQVGILLKDSLDDFDGQASEDRNFTEIDLGTRDAESVWQDMVDYAESLLQRDSEGQPIQADGDVDQYLTDVPYFFLGMNSNATIAMVNPHY